jgi:hypothetical protein
MVKSDSVNKPLVVQWIGRELPELVMWVRFLPRGKEREDFRPARQSLGDGGSL